MTGIEICNLLRQIRKETCEINGIPFEEQSCTHRNPMCNGTCPMCDAYTRILYQKIMLIRKGGGIVRYPSIGVKKNND